MAEKRNYPVPAVRPGTDADAGRIGKLREAGAVRDPITGFFVGVSRRATAKALRADADAAAALEQSANAHTAAIGALINLRNRLDDYQARDELAPQYYDLAKARAFSEIDQERALLGQKTAEARREQLHAKHGLQATRRNRDKNFQLGDARKDARLAEVIDVLPGKPEDHPNPASGDPLADLRRAIANAERARVEKAADGDDTTALQRAIELARQALRDAGVDE